MSMLARDDDVERSKDKIDAPAAELTTYGR
jgi:hypothetical protein